MRDLLIITAFRDGVDVDQTATFVLNSSDSGALPPRAKTSHARGLAQALEQLRRERFRVIMLPDPASLGPGVTELWNEVENHRLFHGARVVWCDVLGHERWELSWTSYKDYDWKSEMP